MDQRAGGSRGPGRRSRKGSTQAQVKSGDAGQQAKERLWEHGRAGLTHCEGRSREVGGGFQVSGDRCLQAGG